MRDCFNELGLETSISISKYKIITTGSITEIYESENGYVRELNRMVDTTRREIGNNGMTENDGVLAFASTPSFYFGFLSVIIELLRAKNRK